MAGRRRTAELVPLHALLESIAARIGEEVGRSLAEELSRPPRLAPLAAPPEPRRCSKPGCGKKLAAKGLCKGHYNLMLYHRRRKAEAPVPAKAKAKRRPARS